MRNWVEEIPAIPSDLPLVATLVSDAHKKAHPSKIDVEALRKANPQRLGGPMIRRTVEGVRVTPQSFGGLDGEWVDVPGGSDRITILYIHGGAFVRGSLVQGRPLASGIAAAVGGRAFAVAYRQAPEYPFPAPIEDAVAAYEYLLDQGVNPKSIVIAGDSCGGGIAVSAAMALRDQGSPLPLATVSISPFADLTLSGPTRTSNAEKDVTGLSFAQAAVAMYLNGADPKTPLASPAYADLTGMPPMLVIVGGHETMYSEAEALADAANRAGVKVILQTYEGMIHVFPMFNLKTGDLAFQKAREFVRAALS